MKNGIWIPKGGNVDKIVATFAEDDFRNMLLAAIQSQKNVNSILVFVYFDWTDVIVWN